MPPRQYSRHSFTFGIQLRSRGEKTLWLTDRIPFSFQQRADNRFHVVQSGDSLFSLAGKYFRPYPRAAGLWWVIADFQPQRIHDPTIELTVGFVMVIPSRRVLEEEIFNFSRRKFG